ncbi:MAG: EthD family reductase [Gammaproteobacteria bacterium]|nr:EthD family reductase [Gammaproteobacteria bacterium]NND53609.1 EthD family reductase [Gammaproteobacteria bacterium]
MIRLVITYPNHSDARFDFDYYIETHMALSRRLLDSFGMGHFEVLRCDQALTGETSECVCITQIEFESLDQLQAGLAVHGTTLAADFCNYTDITPVATVCESVTRG